MDTKKVMWKDTDEKKMDSNDMYQFGDGVAAQERLISGVQHRQNDYLHDCDNNDVEDVVRTDDHMVARRATIHINATVMVSTSRFVPTKSSSEYRVKQTQKNHVVRMIISCRAYDKLVQALWEDKFVSKKQMLKLSREFETLKPMYDYMDVANQTIDEVVYTKYNQRLHVKCEASVWLIDVVFLKMNP